MRISSHVLIIIVLSVLAVAAVTVIAIQGSGYYITAVDERPFHPLYDTFKPTGLYGHGFGIVGTALITGGVILYSTRKRLRVLSGLGKIRHFLNIHIFLCLLGPALVLFHTTFKFGGIVAVSFWSMTAVVLSGVIGRYLYIQIPKGISGNALTLAELQTEYDRIGDELRAGLGPDQYLVERLDALATPRKPVERMGFFSIIGFLISSDLTRRSKQRTLFHRIAARHPEPGLVHRLMQLARRRVILGRRKALLGQIQKLFHYWHVIHLPFTIVMFVILAIHVGVAVAFGYRWIW